MKHKHEPDYARVALTLFLAAILLMGWQILVEWPRRQQMTQTVKEQVQKQAEIQQEKAKALEASDSEYNPGLTRAQRLGASKRIEIRSEKLHGSLSLTGARLDDLTLSRYKTTLDPNSPDVTLFSPNGDPEAYFAQIGWISADSKVPDQKTLWKADSGTLAPGKPVTLRWDNGAGVTFVLSVALDDDYIFTIDQQVENHSGHLINVTPYAYINRAYAEASGGYGQRLAYSEGARGVVNGTLNEVSYRDMRDKGDKSYDNAMGWIGLTDKYWLAALVPGFDHFKASSSHYVKNDQQRYQVDYAGDTQTVTANASNHTQLRLFAGAKELNVLDRYEAGDTAHTPIPLFNRAVDFGMLYFLTIPMFHMLNFFHHLVGNFGLAIMLLTIVVKLAMFPLANKSYKSMAKMRVVQPEMTKLRERYFDDHVALNKEMIALYKRHQVNPASGCLPLLIQMPVFFALYKVLFVTIEMRHAPFISWIRDLSAPDPSNIFDLFGLAPWIAPDFLHLGVLPILMCITMVAMQKQQPAPTDPTQAKMMKIMPYMFLFFFATFPAGLVLYWVWSNTLSILQSAVISKRHGTK